MCFKKTWWHKNVACVYRPLQSQSERQPHAVTYIARRGFSNAVPHGERAGPCGGLPTLSLGTHIYREEQSSAVVLLLCGLCHMRLCWKSPQSLPWCQPWPTEHALLWSRPGDRHRAGADLCTALINPRQSLKVTLLPPDHSSGSLSVLVLSG